MDYLFQSDLSEYLRQTLHVPVVVEPLKKPGKIPVFLDRMYDFFDLKLGERRCIVLAAHKEVPVTPSQIAKHVSLVRSALEVIVVFAARSLAPHNRSRLISQGVGFVIPGNQLYIPELAMDLREHFRAVSLRAAEALTPAAQAVLFDYLLRGGTEPMTPSTIAHRLNYSVTSIARVFHELVSLQLATTERQGKEKYMRFHATGRDLFHSAGGLLRSPVRDVKHIQDVPKQARWKRSGETALAELTDLTEPSIETYAVPASEWPSIAKSFDLVEVVVDESRVDVETWSYDPAILSDVATVDPLSLYAHFSNHSDERVSKAAGKLIEALGW
jgi:hypothetical protein